MKPTDEAKRLREEIVLTISNSEPFTSEYFDDLDYKLIGSIAENSINKVLDAVCMEFNNVGLSAHDTLATKTAINKLRPKP